MVGALQISIIIIIISLSPYGHAQFYRLTLLVKLFLHSSCVSLPAECNKHYVSCLTPLPPSHFYVCAKCNKDHAHYICICPSSYLSFAEVPQLLTTPPLWTRKSSPGGRQAPFTSPTWPRAPPGQGRRIVRTDHPACHQGYPSSCASRPSGRRTGFDCQ